MPGMTSRPGRPRLAWTLAVALVGLAAPPRARADGTAPNERVTSFRADIEVNGDASMRVTETIAVHATGRRIDHGIYRALPTHVRGFFNR
jgi:hypothetical protein